ncbi:hypothetical protein D3C85_1366060 [compost metagenome]
MVNHQVRPKLEEIFAFVLTQILTAGLSLQPGVTLQIPAKTSSDISLKQPLHGEQQAHAVPVASNRQRQLLLDD